jgi:hypothetical protein
MIVLLEGNILATTVYERPTLLFGDRFERLDDCLGTVRCRDSCILTPHVWYIGPDLVSTMTLIALNSPVWTQPGSIVTNVISLYSTACCLV